MTTKLSSPYNFRPTRLFRYRPSSLVSTSVWSGPGSLDYVVIVNTTDAPLTYSLYDVGDGEEADETTVLAYNSDAPPRGTVFFEFPSPGLGIPKIGSRHINVSASAADSVVFFGYGTHA